MASSAIDSRCQFCSGPQAGYTCPKCYKKYCSSNCYKHKSHLKCSEAFYEDQVLSELKTRTASLKSEREMQNILQKLAKEDVGYPGHLDMGDDCEEEDEEEEQEPTWEERFADINFDDVNEGDLWNKLSEEEREEFSALVLGKRIHEFLPVWEPWWLKKDDLVHEMGSDTHLSQCLTNIPPLSKFLKASQPSSLIRYNILNVLYAYVVTMKIYNGDFQDLPINAFETLQQISDNLQKNHTFGKTEDAIGAATQAMEKLELEVTPHFLRTVLEDVICIIEGPTKTPSLKYVVHAMADLNKLLRLAKRSLNDSDEKETKSLCRLCEKKMQFFLSWLKEHGASLFETIPSIQGMIEELKLDVVRNVKMSQGMTSAIEKKLGKQQDKKKPLVQEVS